MKNVTSHTKMLFMVCHFGKDSHLYAVHQPFNGLGICSNGLKLSIKKSVTFANGSGYAFETKLQPFEQLELSVQKKKTIIIIVSLYERLELPV